MGRATEAPNPTLRGINNQTMGNPGLPCCESKFWCRQIPSNQVLRPLGYIKPCTPNPAGTPQLPNVVLLPMRGAAGCVVKYEALPRTLSHHPPIPTPTGRETSRLLQAQSPELKRLLHDFSRQHPRRLGCGLLVPNCGVHRCLPLGSSRTPNLPFGCSRASSLKWPEGACNPI